MAQSQRNKTLEDFKSGKINVLVASDVAARGLDVDGLSLVVNFDVPMNAEDYVHRIGRTGRAGNAGVAITLVNHHDEKYLKGVQSFIRQEIPVMVLEGFTSTENVTPKQSENVATDSPQSNKKEDARMFKPFEKQAAKKQPRNDLDMKDNESGDERRIGFGNDVPAFMLRAVDIKSS
jgi:ATP-dependent RNA helicase RhlE